MSQAQAPPSVLQHPLRIAFLIAAFENLIDPNYDFEHNLNIIPELFGNGANDNNEVDALVMALLENFERDHRRALLVRIIFHLIQSIADAP